MKTITTLLLFITSSTLFSQINNATYTDCNNQTKSIYGVIGSGKVLVIGSKGFDCSVCRSHARSIKDFTDTTMQNIEFWGAMNFKYSVNVPTCTDVSGWITDYSWNNIFMFIDGNDDWEGQGYPTYYVISPFDSSIAYEGVFWTSAGAKAQELADSLALITGIKAKSKNANVFNNAYVSHNQIHINLSSTFKASEIEIFLTDILGNQIVRSKQKISEDKRHLIIPSERILPTGIYMLYITNEGKKLFSRKLFVNQ